MSRHTDGLRWGGASRAAGSAAVLPLLLALAGVAAAATLVGAADGAPSAAGATPGSVSAPDPERLVFPARPEVCGTGDGILIRSWDGTTTYPSGRSTLDADRSWRTGEPPCETGVVVVELDGPADGRTAVHVSVMSEARAAAARSPVTQLTGQQAADRLLAEVRRADGGKASERLVLAASLAADAVVWPTLVELGRDRTLPERARKSAIRWLGSRAAAEAAQTAGVARAIDGLVRDRTETDGVREAAVFALSRLPERRAVPLLIEVVRTIDDPRVRSRALFWLAGYDDGRAVALFEEILLGSG